MALLVAPTLLVANAIDESVYLRAWRSEKTLDDRCTLVLLSGVLALVIGAAVVALARGGFGYATGTVMELSGGMNLRRL